MKRKRIVTATIVVLVTLVIAGGVLAAPEVPLAFGLDWTVAGGGGGHSEAGAFSLDATVGQAVAGTTQGGVYELCSGFWCRATQDFTIFLPVILRNS
jgi:hypothetical protein